MKPKDREENEKVKSKDRPLENTYGEGWGKRKELAKEKERTQLKRKEGR